MTWPKIRLTDPTRNEIPLLDVINLECTRGDRSLFRAVTFSVQPGQLLHVTGRNGAGKTTLLRTLCGLTRPAHGEIRWNGQLLRSLGDEYYRTLAFVGHSNGIQGELTCAENLDTVAGLHTRATTDAIREAMARLGLEGYARMPAKVLSQGQKRRLALARLLLLGKKLWVLDEPFSALDTDSVARMDRIIGEHVQQGGMAILTSHQTLTVSAATLNSVELL